MMADDKPEPIDSSTFVPASVAGDQTLVAYLEALSQTGRVMESCRAAGFTWDQMNKHRQRTKGFADLEDAAMEVYRDTLRREVHRRAVEGIEKPVYYRDQRIDQPGESKVFSDKLLEMLVKRHCPEFQEKVQVDHNVRGGVLVVGGTMGTIENWATKHGGTIDAEREEPDA
jgi:hypothetical protein